MSDIKPFEEGCLIDCHHGLTEANERAIQMARENGWNPTDWDGNELLDEHSQEYFDFVDEAVEYLNNNCILPGYNIEWKEGELMHMPTAWFED